MATLVHEVARLSAPSHPEPRLSLIDRCYTVRDRLLASAAFQRFSAGFLLTRPVATRQARALFDLCAGFVYSQVLAACVRLDLFRLLASGPKTVPELAQQLALPLASTERLLLAATSLRLTSKRAGQRYGLGMLGAALIGNPGIAAMIAHHDMLYRDLEDPVALLRGEKPSTELSRYWAYASATRPAELVLDAVADYSALMAASQSLIAGDVLDCYPFDAHRCLLDVGGGEGAFIAAAAQRFPNLGFMLFDLPAVTERARLHLAKTAPIAHVAVHGGSFVADPLPQGADLVTLVRIVHDHDDATVLALLRAVHRALPPGGTVLIAEPLAGARGAEPVGDAYFGLYLMAMGRGRARRAFELEALLRQAGFTRFAQHKTRRPLLVGAVSAIRG
jgi:demethylspheroidene O-methyltransferase